MIWDPVGRKKRKNRPKTTWMHEIHGIVVEMGLLEKNWRYRENWRQKITGEIEMGIGRCKNIL